jgi:nicotinate-nucleotide adenylyltransferase
VKVGVLGGTFDPVHLGHLAMAEAARESLDLEEVILVPAGRPITKTPGRVTSSEHRLEMLRLAASGSPYLSVSTIEIERPGPSYTVDTVTELRRQYQGNNEIYFILGWDSLAQLTEWREPARIIEMCRLVAVPRPGCPRPDLKLLESSIPGITQRVILLEKPRIDISASTIRELAARGESTDHLVPGAVAEYIREHRLYQRK